MLAQSALFPGYVIYSLDIRIMSTCIFSCICVVPTTPVSDVCAVYDTVNGTLQIIEMTWNEVVC